MEIICFILFICSCSFVSCRVNLTHVPQTQNGEFTKSELNIIENILQNAEPKKNAIFLSSNTNKACCIYTCEKLDVSIVEKYLIRKGKLLVENIKVDVHGENIAFFIVSYDFPSFFLPFFLLSIGSKIWVCWENGNFRSEKWENGNPNYANRKGFQKVTFGYFTSRIQSTCAVRLRFSKFALDLLKSP